MCKTLWSLSWVFKVIQKGVHRLSCCLLSPIVKAWLAAERPMMIKNLSLIKEYCICAAKISDFTSLVKQVLSPVYSYNGWKSTWRFKSTVERLCRGYCRWLGMWRPCSRQCTSAHGLQDNQQRDSSAQARSSTHLPRRDLTQSDFSRFWMIITEPKSHVDLSAQQGD